MMSQDNAARRDETRLSCRARRARSRTNHMKTVWYRFDPARAETAIADPASVDSEFVGLWHRRTLRMRMNVKDYGAD